MGGGYILHVFCMVHGKGRILNRNTKETKYKNF